VTGTLVQDAELNIACSFDSLHLYDNYQFIYLFLQNKSHIKIKTMQQKLDYNLRAGVAKGNIFLYWGSLLLLSTINTSGIVIVQNEYCIVKS